MQVRGISAKATVALSVVALLAVIYGLCRPGPMPADEDAPAYLFQLSVLGTVPMGLLYLFSADWTRPWPSARPLVMAAVALALAFGGLYYLEHIR